MLSKIRNFWILLCFVVPMAHLQAEPQNSKPHALIQQKTDELLVLIEEAKVYFDKEPDRYFEQLSVIVEPMIDFNSFTRNVMGPYGTRDYYRSLSKEDRQAFKTNYKRFVEVFKEGLTQTYGKGLLAFKGEKIRVDQPSEEDLVLINNGKMVGVIQHIEGNDKNYVITYKMRPNKKGEWKLRNVTIDAINVGQIYQKQFASAMKKYDSDFGKVVDNWIEEAEAAEKSAKEQPQS